MAAPMPNRQTATLAQMLRGFIALLAIAAAALPFSGKAAGIERVMVRDSDFRPIRTIAGGPDLATFSELWAARVQQGATDKPRLDYKIDIQSNGRTVRWLYDPAGFALVLSIGKTPIYRLPSPAAFNELLRIRAP
jgi:hypothetical protein